MKAKIIGIVYIERLSNIGSVERMFDSKIQELRNEGRELKSITGNSAKFEDGSRVMKFTQPLIGRRVTHLYIEHGFLSLENAKKFIEEALMPFVVMEGNYKKLDVQGTVRERVIYF